MRGHACSEPATWGERAGCRTLSGEASGLKDAAKLLWIALDPATGDRGIIVDEYIGAEIDRAIVETSLDEDERFAILVARWIRMLIVGARELSV